MTQIDWFVPTQYRDYNKVSASIWIRCYQMIPYLEKLGIQSTINQPDEPGDITYVVRSIEDDAYQYVKQQKKQGKHVIVDFVVNYLNVTDPTASQADIGLVITDQREKALRLLDIADTVTCCSANIKKVIENYHENVHYVPDSVDTKYFNLIKSPNDFERSNLRAIWSGEVAKLDEVKPVIQLLLEHNISLIAITNKRRRILHNGLYNIGLSNIFYKKWQYETFPDDMLSGEFALSYRPIDTAYNRGHSHFKLAVFATQGIPSLASPVESYSELFASGGGHICYTLDEWDTWLSRLRNDRQFLHKLSQEAKHAAEPFSSVNVANQLARVIMNTLNAI